jgi:hypothetical protein
VLTYLGEELVVSDALADGLVDVLQYRLHVSRAQVL